MKAPTDKTNDTIQIVISRSCDLLLCSNCTQLLPFRHDPLHMSVDVFREALRSLAGWPGIRGVFGGNPCSHPQFADLMQVLVDEVPNQRQRGIWTNNLLKHGALVREVFYPHGRFNLNAHAQPAAAAEIDRWLPGRLIPTSRNRSSWHSSILLDWRDAGVSEAAWIEKREACDINLTWSAAIFEREGRPYAYFCEVAGALDGVRGENNGILAEPGWWQWKMPRFAHQVSACCDKGCGVPLRQLGQLDNDRVYDVSPAFLPVVNARKYSKLGVALQDGPLAMATERPTDYQALKSEKSR